MKTTLFVSQPMRGKTQEEIFADRERAVKVAEQRLGETVNVEDSVFATSNTLNPLFYLGMALQRMAMADVVIFAKGWQDSRGCRIEHECAKAYGIKTILYE